MYGNQNYGDNGGGGVAPVKVDQELDVKVEAVGEKGDGIAREKGFVLFVAGTKVGDEVRVRVTKVLAKVGFAEVIGKASPGGAKERPKKKVSGSSQAEEAPEEVVEEATLSPEDTDDFGEEEEKENEEEPSEEEVPAEEETSEEEPSDEEKKGE